MKNSKILLFCIALVLAVFVLSAFSLDLIKDKSHPKVLLNINLNVNSDFALAVKEGKLYNKNTGVYLDNQGESLYEEYKAIGIYDIEDYYFAVFSLNQNCLQEDMFTVDYVDEQKQSVLYIIDKASANGVKVDFPQKTQTYRVDLSSIEFIAEDKFTVAKQDVFNALPNDLICVKIIKDKNLFQTLSTTLCGVYTGNALITRYEICETAVALQYEKSGVLQTEIMSLNINFEYEIEKYNEKNYISYYSASFGAKSLNNRYLNEKYLSNGFFAKYGGSIVYLSNDFTVKEVVSDKIVEKLNSAQEFNKKYLNN